MVRILSTKKLERNQEELLLNAGLSLVQYDGIRIEMSEFKIPQQPVENAVFTSKNAVKAILQKAVEIQNAFCVGDKTAALLEEQGISVKVKAQDASELAMKITTDFSEANFIFFCGNKRRDELPETLKKHRVKIDEIEVYRTSLRAMEFPQPFDGILFFSPSGVQSYHLQNQMQGTAFCIGETTASEARKHTKNIVVAARPGIENLIAKAVNHFRKETHQ
ncbi:MAG: uroporphyrinogen-III synthase [Bacteroidota bacterium]|nr:uroporphyrinogen-III synthase [Bacteroidota bacterium]